jgi:hypothetical protein
VAEVARRRGIEAALGEDFQGKLAMWQVVARVLGQGSRLSAVRLAQLHAAGDVLGLKRVHLPISGEGHGERSCLGGKQGVEGVKF